MNDIKKQHLKINEDVKWHYEQLLQIRHEDNRLFWDRVKLILASQTGLLAVYAVTFDKLRELYPTVIVFVSLLGLGLSLFLHKIISGGLYWVLYWQREMEKIERESLNGISIFLSMPSKTKNNIPKKFHPNLRYVSGSIWIHALGFFLLSFWMLVCAFSLYIWIKQFVY